MQCRHAFRHARPLQIGAAARAVGLIAWAASMAGDRIGAIGYGPGLNGEVKPAGGSRGVLRILRALAQWDAITTDAIRVGTAKADTGKADTPNGTAPASTGVPLSQALQRAQRLAAPGSQIILVGDGLDCDPAAESALSMLADHCDVAAVLVSDALEQTAPPPARYAVQNSTGRRLLDFTMPRARADWEKQFSTRRQLLIDMLKRRALNHTMLDTRAEPESVLRTLLGFDARRRKAATGSA